MQDVEIDDLRRKIERYENLLRSVGDERTRREIERLLEEAKQRLEEIEKRSEPSMPPGEPSFRAPGDSWSDKRGPRTPGT